MKKQAYIHLFYLLFFPGYVCMAQPDKPKTVYSVYTGSFSGTGNPGNEWFLSTAIHLSPLKGDNRMTVRSLWDSDSLYFRIEVADRDLRAYQQEKDHPELYLDDMVEILLDTKNDKTSCWAFDDIVYHINLLGQKKDDRGSDSCRTDRAWDGTANYSIRLFGTLNDTTDIDSGYEIEIAFPWNELDISPVNNMRIGADFANGDNDGNGRSLYDWVGAEPMRNPQMFGTLILTF
ncbi:MAG: CBM9 family sugar-binding protein [Tannerella sp.]|jgi:hypothetical protein|nr:CBM9 family sugar-binding protein [Tannerella sp.]